MILVNGVAFVSLYPEAYIPTELSFIQIYSIIIWDIFSSSLDVFLPFSRVASIKIYCI